MRGCYLKVSKLIIDELQKNNNKKKKNKVQNLQVIIIWSKKLKEE